MDSMIVIDEMLGLTADIAEELLLIKDAGHGTLPDGLKLKIISLAELAASAGDGETLGSGEKTIVDADMDADEPPVVRDAGHSAPEPIADDDALVVASAEFEERADADIENPETLGSRLPENEIIETDTVVDCGVPDVDGGNILEKGDFPDGDNLSEDKEITEKVGIAEEDISQEEGLREEDPEVASVMDDREDERILRMRAQGLRSAFSINDAFLFRREIFGGSRPRFEEAVEHLAALPSLEALRDYLVEELGLDLDETPGKEFYGIVQGLFR